MPQVRLTAGHDVYTVRGAHYFVLGLAGNDNITGSSHGDTLNGGIGNDTLTGLDGSDSLLGGNGNDTIYASGPVGDDADYTGDDTVHGGQGNDRILTANGTQTADGEFHGDKGNDTIEANVNNGYFLLAGEQDNDTISMGLIGSNATFDAFGGTGNDTISGVGGFETIRGGDGNDQLNSSFGVFTLEGGIGNDVLQLGSFSTGELFGGQGNDTLTGIAQRDAFVMHGGAGNDHLEGTGNFSVLNEVYFGDSGNDTIISLGGYDTLEGGTGADRMKGGDGNDQLTGGTGEDVFVFGPRGDTGTSGTDPLTDIITDFQDRVDRIEFHGLGLTFHALTIQKSGPDAVIHYTDNQSIVETIVVEHTSAQNFTAQDFLFT